MLQFEGFVRRGSEAIEICAQPTAAWIAWASCKAFWLGDATHRRQMLGTETPVFSNVEELECLRALLQGYERERATEPDPSLEELRDISRGGELDVLVLLELATRVDPHAALRVPARVRPRLVRYVLRHVLVEGEGPRSTHPDRAREVRSRRAHSPGTSQGEAGGAAQRRGAIEAHNRGRSSSASALMRPARASRAFPGGAAWWPSDSPAGRRPGRRPAPPRDGRGSAG